MANRLFGGNRAAARPNYSKTGRNAKTRSQDEATFVIDNDGRVHMASMDIHFSQSTNGVARSNTDILKNEELHSFYELYPNKFNNKTNGITFRRWLFEANPELTKFLDEHIGEGYKKDAVELQKLLQFKDDKKVLEQLLDIKAIKKRQLAKYLKEQQNVDIDEHSIYDIQIKRLHEYKRQQMNALYIIDEYLKIKTASCQNARSRAFSAPKPRRPTFWPKTSSTSF